MIAKTWTVSRSHNSIVRDHRVNVGYLGFDLCFHPYLKARNINSDSLNIQLYCTVLHLNFPPLRHQESLRAERDGGRTAVQ